MVGGTLLWRPLRRTLDVGVFGINAYVAPNAGNDVVEEATFTLGGEPLDAPAGTVVFVRDPQVRRHARAEEPQTAGLAVGGP